jgi:aquaporin related protein
MFLVGALSALRASILAFVQILGGITGAAIIDALTPGKFRYRFEIATLANGAFLPQGR